MRKFDLVVFDMAGTTVQDRGNVADAFIKSFAGEEMTISREDAKKVMGWRKKDAIRILLQKNYPGRIPENGELIDRIHEAFIHTMISFYHTDPDLRPLPHAEELFRMLKRNGVKIALNTGFTRAISDAILERLNWQEGDTIDVVICSDEVPEGRPHPYMIQAIMKKLAIQDPARVVKIGDTEADVEEGQNAGCGLVVGITTGAYTRDQLSSYHPDAIIDSLDELTGLIG